MGEQRGILFLVDVLDNDYSERQVIESLAKYGYRALRVVDNGPAAQPASPSPAPTPTVQQFYTRWALWILMEGRSAFLAQLEDLVRREP